ncbi:plasmid mobilization protein [Kitasatospora cineracea]|uniref:plasmid mobilization protein n=1 Tax=Kitasatospora cineracea TaxID=88074 RepID=UPI0037FF4863
MNTTRQPFNDQPGNPVSSLGCNGVDHLQANSGASECVRGPYGATPADARAQEGVDVPVLPRAAAPELHREGAAKQETTLAVEPHPSARAVERAPRAGVRRAKRRRRDNDNPKTKKLGFRCTAERQAEIKRLAQEASLNVADYLERQALTPGGATTVTRDEQLDQAVQALAAARFQVSRLGINVNQIAFQLNAEIGIEHGPAQATLAKAREAVAEVRRAVAGVDATAMRVAKAARR